MDLSIAGTYLKFRDKFSSLEDYLVFLVQASETRGIIYYRTKPDQVFEHGDSLMVSADLVNDAYKSLDYPEITDDEVWEFEDEEDEPERNDVIFENDEVVKYFVSRKIYLDKQELEQFIEKHRFKLLEYLVTERKNKVHNISLMVKDVLPLEESIVPAFELLVDYSSFLSLLTASKHSLLLKKYINPAKNYRSATVLVGDTPLSEPYNEGQSSILRLLYEGTLGDPKYLLSFEEIRRTVTGFSGRPDDSIKPGSSFRDKLILRYLASEKKSYYFKLPDE